MTRETIEDKYEHPITARRKDFNMWVNVRKMDKDEMPDDGIVYYADTDCTIHREDQLELSIMNGERSDD